MENPRTRNDAIERLLREADGTFGAEAAGACASPEEVAAWLEGGLAAPEAARLEAHAASCSECQALVGAFARTLPSAQGRAWANLRWAGPLAAAAVLVLGVWLTRPDQDARSSVAPETQVARLEDAPVPRPTDPTPAAPTAPQASPREESAGAALDLNRQGLPDRRASNDAVAPPAAAIPPAPPSAAAPAPALAPSVAEAAPAAEEKRERDEARAKALASAAAPSRARLAEGERAATAFSARSDARSLSVASPSGRTACRIGPASVVEASSDGGLTWAAVEGSTPAVAAAVVGGASPSDGVCWMVGRGGVVLLVRDGRASAVRPPDTGDLTTVQAEDAAAAVVGGAGGRAWRTRDGGRTWSAVATPR